jgi:hypothetical protein
MGGTNQPLRIADPKVRTRGWEAGTAEHLCTHHRS